MPIRSNLPDLAARHAGLILSIAVVISLMTNSILSGAFGKIGWDTDDIMRLVQVRELLGGKGWYDLWQLRLGPEGGTLMHWSRLVDLPIASIAFLLTPFVGQETAIAAAISAWPLISVLIVTVALVAGARALGGRFLLLFTCLLGLGLLFFHPRFLPGAIDHHNLQLGLLTAAAVGQFGDSRGLRGYALSGASLALAAAVGVEVYIFVAAMAAFVALDWALTGEPARKAAVVFGASFAATLTAAFLITVHPLAYGAVYCDALSSVSLLAGVAGGAGLALAAQLASPRTLVVRLGALGLVGVFCLGFILLLGPHCLSNPLNALSPEAKALWLDRVTEAHPVFADWPDRPANILFRLGPALAGLGAAAYLAWKAVHRREMLIFVLLLTISVALTIYQTRFYIFGQLFAILPLALLAAKTQSGDTGLPRLSYMLLVLLGFPTSWATLGIVITPKTVAAPETDVALCLTPEAVAALQDLPPGRILASPNDTPGILLETQHSALHGNYHRNTAGIDAAISILTGPMDDVQARLAASRVSYVMVCPGDPNLRFFADYAPDGLIARLMTGDVPGWLEPAASAGETVVYRVRR